MKLNWNLQRGWGGAQKKILSMGEACIFSGITQFAFKKNFLTGSYNLDFYNSLDELGEQKNDGATISLC